VVDLTALLKNSLGKRRGPADEAVEAAVAPAPARKAAAKTAGARAKAPAKKAAPATRARAAPAPARKRA
jgi:hypothetical protein